MEKSYIEIILKKSKIRLAPQVRFFIIRFIYEFGIEPAPSLSVKKLAAILGVTDRVVTKSTRYYLKENILNNLVLGEGNTIPTALASYQISNEFKKHSNNELCVSKWSLSFIQDLLDVGENKTLSKHAELSVANRLLLIALFSCSNMKGKIYGVGREPLCAMTGMTREQLKTQTRKLIDLGYLKKSIEGGSSKTELGRLVNSYQLELQHHNFKVKRPQYCTFTYLLQRKDDYNYIHSLGVVLHILERAIDQFCRKLISIFPKVRFENHHLIFIQIIESMSKNPKTITKELEGKLKAMGIEEFTQFNHLLSEFLLEFEKLNFLQTLLPKSMYFHQKPINWLLVMLSISETENFQGKIENIYKGEPSSGFSRNRSFIFCSRDFVLKHLEEISKSLISQSLTNRWDRIDDHGYIFEYLLPYAKEILQCPKNRMSCVYQQALINFILEISIHTAIKCKHWLSMVMDDEKYDINYDCFEFHLIENKPKAGISNLEIRGYYKDPSKKQSEKLKYEVAEYFEFLNNDKKTFTKK